MVFLLFAATSGLASMGRYIGEKGSNYFSARSILFGRDGNEKGLRPLEHIR
jgi:hypothetical protein